ncbi:uncharacterized protein TNCV_3494201 [Trichonephila clavipes]|nr:uncharacterized protein TNCV_3494201 [Trichonephila clavipes]
MTLLASIAVAPALHDTSNPPNFFTHADLAIPRVHHEEACYITPKRGRSIQWRVLIKPNCVSDSPRAAAVAEFRLLTGHDCLCAHLYHFNLTDSPFCVLWASGQVMNASHLDVRSALKSLDCSAKSPLPNDLMVNGLAFDK